MQQIGLEERICLHRRWRLYYRVKLLLILPLDKTLWKSVGLVTNLCLFLQQGLSKSSFVNDVTVAANKSVQVVA